MNDIPYTSYLKNKTSSTFIFSEITEETVMRTINDRSAKRSTCHESISTELLKRIKAFIAKPLCLIVNQSLNTGIFPGKLIIAKVIPLYKKETQLSSVITDQFLNFRLSLKYLKKLYIINYLRIYLRINYYTEASIALENNILLKRLPLN